MAREDIKAKDAEIARLKIQLEAMKRERDMFKAQYEKERIMPIGSFDDTELSTSARKDTNMTVDTHPATNPTGDFNEELRAIIKDRDEKAAELKLTKDDAARKDAQLQLAHQLIATVYDSAKTSLEKDLTEARDKIFELEGSNRTLQRRLDDSEAAFNSLAAHVRYIGTGGNLSHLTLVPAAAAALGHIGPESESDGLEWLRRFMEVLLGADSPRILNLQYLLTLVEESWSDDEPLEPLLDG